jgi:hypothetical protein
MLAPTTSILTASRIWLVDTTCGASTCFDTVVVRSWDGDNRRRDRQHDRHTPTAKSLEEARDAAQGSEIILQGGEYGSVGAGPAARLHRGGGSVEGAPYQLLDKVYERSNCLYFAVLDANALNRHQEIGLVQA